MTPPLLAAIGILTSALNLLLAIFLLFGRGAHERANRFLAGFFILTAIDLIGWATELLPAAIQPWIGVRAPLAFMQMPWLFAYVLLLVRPDRSSRRHRQLGWICVLLSMLALLASFAAPEWGRAVGRSTSVVLHIQYYVYIALIGWLLFGPDAADAHAVRGPTMTWLRVLLIGSLVAGLFVFAKTLAWFAGNIVLYSGLDLIVGCNAALISCALTLMALLRQDILIAPAMVAAPEHVSAGSPNPDAVARLHDWMQMERPYLDPELTLRKLARRFAMPARELSQLINRSEGVHFFDFVNRYRVEEAARLLADPAQRDQTILAIAYAVGFNSKSSFNAAFLRHKGSKPSDWRAGKAV